MLAKSDFNLADEETFCRFLRTWAEGSQASCEWEGDASTEQFWQHYFEPDAQFMFDGIARNKDAIKFWLAQDRQVHGYRVVDIHSFVSSQTRVACSYVYSYTETEDGEPGEERFATAMITADLNSQTRRLQKVHKLTRTLNSTHSTPVISRIRAVDELERELSGLHGTSINAEG